MLHTIYYYYYIIYLFNYLILQVNYICEMIAVLEDRLMNHFANVLTAKASEVVQNALIRKAALKAKITNHENAIMVKLVVIIFTFYLKYLNILL